MSKEIRREEFTKIYVESVNSLAETGNVDPCPLLVLAGDQLTSAMLVCGSVSEWSEMIRQTLRRACADSDLRGAAIGLDRVTRPGQGTDETGSVFTFAVWWRESPAEEPHLQVGIVEYDEGRVLPARWDNAHWREQFDKDLRATDVAATLFAVSGAYSILQEATP